MNAFLLSLAASLLAEVICKIVDWLFNKKGLSENGAIAHLQSFLLFWIIAYRN